MAGKVHRLAAIQRERGTGRHQALCSCGWRSGHRYNNPNAAWTAWERQHTIPRGDTREDSPNPRYTEI